MTDRLSTQLVSDDDTYRRPSDSNSWALFRITIASSTLCNVVYY